jgi:hypothetical protein
LIDKKVIEERSNIRRKKLLNKMMKIKKARLVEENMNYDDLATLENFSENEISIELNR